MLILVILCFYGGGLAPKGRVCVLGGKDVLDSDQQTSSFLLLLYLHLSENLQKDLHWRCGFARKHSRRLAACEYRRGKDRGKGPGFTTMKKNKFYSGYEE